MPVMDVPVCLLMQSNQMLPIKMIKIFNDPNSDFPNGVPNPLLD